MFRYSTSEFTYTLPEDMQYQIIRVSYAQKGTLILTKQYDPNGTTSSGITVDENTVNVFLTQEETGRFSPGYAKTQVKVYTDAQEAPYSEEYRFIVKDVEDPTVLPEVTP